MGNVVDLAGFRTQRREIEAAIASMQSHGGEDFGWLIPEFNRRTLSAFEAVAGSIELPLIPDVSAEAAIAIGKAAADQIEKRYEILVRSLCGHLLLTLIEIDWMHSKRAFMPVDLKATFEAILTAALTAPEIGD